MSERRAYNVGVVKIPYAARDVAHTVITAEDPREFFDIIGADTPDDDHRYPVGARCTYRVMLTDAEAERFRGASNARYVELDVEDTAMTAPWGTGDTYIPRAASLEFMEATFPGVEHWHGRDVTLAVVDGGTTAAVRAYMGWNRLDRFENTTTPAGVDEITHHHGCWTTACAVPPGGQYLEAVSSTDSNTINRSNAVAAWQWLADNGAKIISFSFSGTAGSETSVYADGVAMLRDHPNGPVQLYCSVGNDGANQINTPAGYCTTFANVHGVMNVDEATGLLSTGSNYDNQATGSAPGTNVLGLDPAGFAETWSGTSASAPHAARLCAMLCTGGRYTPAQAAAALRANMRPLGLDAEREGGGTFSLQRALDALGGFSVMWTVVAGPAHVGEVLSFEEDVSFTPTVAGQYTLRLTAENEYGTTTDDLILTVTGVTSPEAPTAPLPVAGQDAAPELGVPAGLAAVTMAGQPGAAALELAVVAAELVATGQALSASLAPSVVAAAVGAGAEHAAVLTAVAPPADTAAAVFGGLTPTVEAAPEVTPAAAPVTAVGVAPDQVVGVAPAAAGTTTAGADPVVTRESRPLAAAAAAATSGEHPQPTVLGNPPTAAATAAVQDVALTAEVPAPTAAAPVVAEDGVPITSGEVLPDPASATVAAPQVVALAEALAAAAPAEAGASSIDAVAEVGASAAAAATALTAQPGAVDSTSPAPAAGVATEVPAAARGVNTAAPPAVAATAGVDPQAGGSRLVDADLAAVIAAAHGGDVELGMLTGVAGGPVTVPAVVLDQQVLVDAPAAEPVVAGQDPQLTGAADGRPTAAGGPFTAQAPGSGGDIPAADASASVGALSAAGTANDVYEIRPDPAALGVTAYPAAHVDIGPGPQPAGPNPVAYPVGAEPATWAAAATVATPATAAGPSVAPSHPATAAAVAAEGAAVDAANRHQVTADGAGVQLSALAPGGATAPTPNTAGAVLPAIPPAAGVGPATGPGSLVLEAQGVAPEVAARPAAGPVGTEADRPGLAITGAIDVPAPSTETRLDAHPSTVRISARTHPVPPAETTTAGVDVGVTAESIPAAAAAVVRPERPSAQVTPPPVAPAGAEAAGQDPAPLPESRPTPTSAGVAVFGQRPGADVVTGALTAGPTVQGLAAVAATARNAAADTASLVAAAAGPGVRVDTGVLTALCMLAAADAIAVVPALQGSVEPWDPARPTLEASQSPGPSIVGDTVRAAIRRIEAWRRERGPDE